ncbi:hypothetical protein BDV59DRAFT_187279 [Aspergillus ambiguus]|uniref:DUF3844 domain-containing protein n=1 Tax=Aspergillus ambiguus TaxID=176160 RepID=UPI003CCE4E3D
MLQLSKSVLALSVTASLASRACGASVFAFDSYSSWGNLDSPVISDDTAKRLLELRMEAPMSTLGTVDHDTVELLNTFGGSPTPLFSTSSGSDESTKNLLIVRGVDSQVASSIRDEYPNNLLVSHPSTEILNTEFVGQLLGLESGTAAGEGHCVSVADSKAGSNAAEATTSCLRKSALFKARPQAFNEKLLDQAQAVESWTSQNAPVSVLAITLELTKSTDPLRALFRGLQDLALGGNEVTALLLPAPANESKRTLNLRNVPAANTIHHLSAREYAEQTSLPVAPVCYASNSSCSEATNGCSGHGFCYKKSSAADDGDCYACKCQETTIRREDGSVQKVRWGGAACQKRDISSPFFLIAGISILVVVAISTAIGMLFTVGQGELPGVISAGVGATSSQK